MKKINRMFWILIILLCLSATAYAHEWEWITSTDTMGFYYSKGSARLINDTYIGGGTGHIKAWIKTQVEDENERQKWINKFERNSERDYSNYYYDITHYEYKNLNGTIYMRSLYWAAYDYSGDVIETINNISKWTPVVPNSIGMTVYLFVMVRAI